LSYSTTPSNTESRIVWCSAEYYPADRALGESGLSFYSLHRQPLLADVFFN
jgi:hypothetical protein